MTYSLLTEPWIPVRRRDGTAGWVAPHEVAATEANPVVAIDWPRPDFRLATLEFLIGLLATACPPVSDTAWLRIYRNPPSADDLARAFAPLASAFVLDGDGPRFMQDLEDFPEDPIPVSQLLIEAPGKATIDKNTDLLVHRGQVTALSRAAAAMALFTLQTYAPSGGAGNRTSLRGGGPLTTLALPPNSGDPVSLWHSLWSNVPVRERPIDPAQDLPRIFPWLVKTRVSDKSGRATTPADVDVLQAFWGMPRRIRLNFDAMETRCDITGETDTIGIRSWRQRPWGTNYSVWGGYHPLSPCYQMKSNTELLFLHPQPGGIGYQHWQSLLSLNPAGTAQIAPAILTFRKDRVPNLDTKVPWRLLAAGFDMDNMKARGFVEAELPVYEPKDPARAKFIDDATRALVAAADIVAVLLVRCVRRALFSEGAEVKIQDASTFNALRDRFWSETADAFFASAQKLAEGDDADEIYKSWHQHLARTARRLLFEAAPMEASGAGHPERIAAASRDLGTALAGYGKSGTDLFNALGFNAPEAAKNKSGRKGKRS